MVVGMKVGRLNAMFERMSDRERKLVFGGTALVLAVLLVLGGVLVSRKVGALEDEVAGNETAMREVVQLGPTYLRMRAEEKSLTDQLERASKEPLQAVVLNIAKQIQFERVDAEGNTTSERLSDTIKFSNSSEILAELTQKAKKGQKRKTNKKAGGREVFLASIDAVFMGVPDEAVMRFLAKLETNPDPLFGLALDLSRNATSRDQFQATIKIGQFRFGNLEEGE
jgi:hypothetical protein